MRVGARCTVAGEVLGAGGDTLRLHAAHERRAVTGDELGVGAEARYEDRVGDNHHHLICRSCRRMVDVDCAVGDTPCLTAADDSGYEVDEAEVIYWGRCPECVAADGDSTSTHQQQTSTKEKDARV